MMYADYWLQKQKHHINGLKPVIFLFPQYPRYVLESIKQLLINDLPINKNHMWRSEVLISNFQEFFLTQMVNFKPMLRWDFMTVQMKAQIFQADSLPVCIIIELRIVVISSERTNNPHCIPSLWTTDLREKMNSRMQIHWSANFS